MPDQFSDTETFVDQVKVYLNTRLSQLKLSFAERISKVMAVMTAMVLSALVFFLVLVLISVAGAIAIGLWLENFWLGFLIVAGIVLLIGFVLWRSKESWLRKPIMNALIQVMFDKEENEKDQ
jgi:hypothetical protein